MRLGRPWLLLVRGTASKFHSSVSSLHGRFLNDSWYVVDVMQGASKWWHCFTVYGLLCDPAAGHTIARKHNNLYTIVRNHKTQAHT